MLSTFAKVAKVLPLIVGSLLIGVITLLQPVAVAQQRQAGTAAQNKKQQDRFGDALPDGAVARMGTIRWRHPAAITFVGFTKQGKHLFTSCMDGVHRVWEVTSGKEIRRFGDAIQQPGNAGQVIMINGNARMMFAGGGGGSNLALSRDGKVLATQAADGIHLWDVESGKKLRTLSPDKNAAMPGAYAITGLSFAPDGATLAVRSFDQTIRLWNVADGKQVLKLGKEPGPNVKIVNRFGFGGGGRNLAFSADGKAVLSAGMTYENQKQIASIQSFDAKTGKEIRQLKLPLNNVSPAGMTISPDGKTLAWTMTDGTVRLFDTENGKETGQLGPQKQPGYMTSLVYAPDGKTLASRRTSGTGITLWDMSSRKELRTLGGAPAQNANPFRARAFIGGFGGYGGGQETVAFAPDGKTLVEVTAGNSVRLWNVADGKEIQTTSAGHHGGVTQLVVSADAKNLMSRGTDGTIRRWELGTGQELGQVKLPADAVNSILSADGKTIFCANNANSVRVLDAATGKELRAINVAPPQQGAIRFAGIGNFTVAPDGKLLAIAGFDQTIRVFDTISGKEVHNLTDQGAKPDPKGGRVALVASGYYGGSTSIAFSPDGRLLSAAGVSPQNVMFNGGGVVIGGAGQPGAGSSIRLWDLVQARRPRSFDPKASGFLAQAFTPDGRTIVTANSDSTVSLWENLTGKECLQIKLRQPNQPAAPNPAVNRRLVYTGMQMGATSLAVSPDGRTLAVSFADQAIRLFDLRSGKEMGKFQGHNGQVLSLAFAPDSRTIISGSADTTALVWDGARFINKDSEPRGELTAQQVTDLWQDLAADPVKAYQAIIAWRAVPKQAVAQFKQLKPAAGVDAKRIEQLISELETAKYEVRQKATDALEKLGELAEPALRKAIGKGPSLEMRRRLDMLVEKIVNDKVPPAETLRALRAVQILEHIGDTDARAVLQRLAEGAAGHRLTRHAQAALKRP